ncbi:MAG: hypothetical protein DLM60_10660 [Pseudonocardiales bacterium]|nr:MAG: hypothetical protein DLM60_10660 [Pseudonocardiales bacterium]
MSCTMLSSHIEARQVEIPRRSPSGKLWSLRIWLHLGPWACVVVTGVLYWMAPDTYASVSALGQCSVALLAIASAVEATLARTHA